jgi:hypothetical protein
MTKQTNTLEEALRSLSFSARTRYYLTAEGKGPMFGYP